MSLQTDTSGDSLYHAYFIDVEIAGTTYYLCDLYQDHDYAGNTYQALGELVGVGDITSGISPGVVATAFVLSGIENVTDYKALALDPKSKGGNVVIRRGLSPTSVHDIIANDKIYTMFQGFVKNISFAEDFPEFGAAISDTIIFSCSNLWGIKTRQVKGRKTNPEDFNEYTRYSLGLARDPVMDRVSAINGQKFAFGRTA